MKPRNRSACRNCGQVLPIFGVGLCIACARTAITGRLTREQMLLVSIARWMEKNDNPRIMIPDAVVCAWIDWPEFFSLDRHELPDAHRVRCVLYCVRGPLRRKWLEQDGDMPGYFGLTAAGSDLARKCEALAPKP